MTRDVVSRRRHEWVARRRSREAALAALVAAQNREAFDPEHVEGSVFEMLDAAAVTWTAGDHVQRADQLEGALRAWARAHFHGQGSTLHGSRSVSLLRVISREQASEDRVSVRVRFAIRHGHQPHASEPQIGRYDERWILAHEGPVWRLVEFDAEPLADQLLRAPQIGASYQDTGRLAEQSLEELARVR